MNNEEKRIENDEIEIDLTELIRVLWKKAFVIILAGIICGAAVFAGSKMLITPQYDSTTKIYIVSKQSSGQSAYYDIELGSQMTQDYIELIKSRSVLEKVISQCNLDMSVATLAGTITVENPEDTHILSITVRNADPKMAQKIANTLREAAAVHIKRITDIDAVNTVDNANLPKRKSHPSNVKNGVLGALLGMILSSGFFVVRYLMDDNIKNSDDVEKYLGMNVLATLPISADMDSKKKKKSKKNNRSDRR